MLAFTYILAHGASGLINSIGTISFCFIALFTLIAVFLPVKYGVSVIFGIGALLIVLGAVFLTVLSKDTEGGLSAVLFGFLPIVAGAIGVFRSFIGIFRK